MIIVSLAGCVAYSEMLAAGFVWDDAVLVVNNRYIVGLSHFKDIWTRDLGAGAGQIYYFYRPLQTLSYLFDHQLFGLNPSGYHVVNLLWHLIAGWGVFALARRLTDDAGVAIAAAGFFILHPVHTSVVCYIASRADLLCGVAMVWAVATYIKTISPSQTPHRSFLIWMAPALYLLALLAKESALVLPLLLGVFHIVYRIPIGRWTWLSFGSITVGYMIWRLIGVAQILSPSMYHVPLMAKVPGVFVALRQYVRLLIAPADLHMHYGNVLFAWRDPLVWQGIVIFVALMALIAFARRRQPLVAFGCAWFLTALIAVAVFPLNAFMAESWLYVPSVGFAIVAATLLRSLRWKIASIVVTLMVGGIYSLIVIDQTRYWQDDVSLLAHTAKYSPASGKIFYNLGNAYRQRGQIAQAVECYQKALVLNPQIVEAATALREIGPPN